MYESKISAFCRQTVRMIGIIMIGYLFLQGLFTICCIQAVTERTYYMQNNVWRQLAGIVLFSLLVRILWTQRVRAFLNKYGSLLGAAVLAGVVLFLGFWVWKTQFWYASDMEQIYIYAEKLLAGDYSGWQSGGYPYGYPHQNGFLLLVAFLQTFLSQGGCFMALYLLNILFYVATIIAIFFILKQLYQEQAVCSLQGIMLLCFLPYSFFCLMMYSNIISFGWACISMALGLWYCKDYRFGKLIGSAICMVFAIVMKQNQLIVFLAILVLFGFEWINSKQKKGKLAIGIVVYIAIVMIGTKIPNWTIEQITGMEVGPGNSRWSWIAMGLMETDSTPGWYNRYNVDIFESNNGDYNATAAAAKADAMEILQDFAENPAQGWRFFNLKLASEWNNPTFECFNVQNARSTALELSGVIKSTINDGGKINIMFIYIFDVFQAIVWFGALLYLITADKAGWDKLLFLVLFIGGVLFYLVWEAKSQYVVYYFLLLIPYSLLGYVELMQAGLPRLQLGSAAEKPDTRLNTAEKKTFHITGWNKVHTAILVLAILIVVIGLMDAEWICNSLKIYVDTEGYYEYIHQYNQNFVNLRF